MIRVDWWLSLHWFPLTPISYLQIFLWRKHFCAALSSGWFKGNDCLCSRAELWLVTAWSLAERCMCLWLNPANEMHGDFHWGLWKRNFCTSWSHVTPVVVICQHGSSLPKCKSDTLRREEPRKFLRVDAIMLEARPTSRLQFCESVTSFPVFFFFFSWLTFFLIWVFCNLQRFLLIQTLFGASCHVACTCVTVYFSSSSKLITCPFSFK